jgi:transcriptional regulator with XRE-family HTH domain
LSASVEQARKALGARLREIRKDADLTARAFAASAGWHYTKVSKLENGARTPSQADIRDWCHICGAEDQVPDLIAAARDVESMYAEWRRQLKAGMRRSQAARLPVYERTRLFRLYEPALVPGILQTAQYAAAVIGSFLAFTQAATDLNEAVAARMEWQRIIYGDHEFQVVLEEQALRTRAGDAGTMTGQLDRLLAVMSLPGVELSVIPVSAPRKVMPSGGFLIFDDEMVQAETVSAELTVSQPHEIALYARRFSFLRQSAVSGRDVRNLIHRALAEFAGLPLPTSVNIVAALTHISVASLLRPVAAGDGGREGGGWPGRHPGTTWERRRERKDRHAHHAHAVPWGTADRRPPHSGKRD